MSYRYLNSVWCGRKGRIVGKIARTLLVGAVLCFLLCLVASWKIDRVIGGAGLVLASTGTVVSSLRIGFDEDKFWDSVNGIVLFFLNLVAAL